MKLCSKGAAIDQAKDSGATPLFIACEEGHTEVVAMLCSEGAAIYQAAHDGATPLFIACEEGHAEVVEKLCSEGAAIDQAMDDGATPLYIACRRGHLAAVCTLSSHGAQRLLSGEDEADVAAARGHTELAAWLTLSRQWSTPLHHLDIITAPRARALLRDGASIHAAVDGGPTPLSLAQAMHIAGNVADGSPAHLVLRVAAPWRFSTHELFATGARERAVALLLLGSQLSNHERFFRQEDALKDVWLFHIMPQALGGAL